MNLDTNFTDNKIRPRNNARNQHARYRRRHSPSNSLDLSNIKVPLKTHNNGNFSAINDGRLGTFTASKFSTISDLRFPTNKMSSATKPLWSAVTSIVPARLPRHFLFFTCLALLASFSATAADSDKSDGSILVRSLGAVPTPSPEENFTEQPRNTSVVMGQIAVMKCKVSSCETRALSWDRLRS